MVERSNVGADLGTVSFPVERGKVREFWSALLEDDPAVLDAERPTPPPTFTASAALWAPPAGRALGLARGRVLHGEQEYAYLAPVRTGDVLTGRRRLADVFTKEGSRGGTLTFVVIETTYENQEGNPVVVERNTLVETSRPASED